MIIMDTNGFFTFPDVILEFERVGEHIYRESLFNTLISKAKFSATLISGVINGTRDKFTCSNCL